MSDERVKEAGCGIGCFFGFMLFNAILGGVSVDYCLWWIAGKNIPFFADMIIGFFVAEISIPLMVVLWLLSLFGVGG